MAAMAADRTPGGFGSRLREARERRGITLRQIANATKISMSVLEALERNDISRLPGGIFGRAFVRSYAIEVGLEPEETIEEFISQFPHDSLTARHPASERIHDNESLESDRRMASVFLRLIGLSVPVAGIVLYFGFTGRSTAPVTDSPPATTAPAASASLVPGPAPNAPATTDPTTTTAASASDRGLTVPGAPAPASSAVASIPPAAGVSTSGPTPQPVAPSDSTVDLLVVGLAAIGRCSVSVMIDGQAPFVRQFQPGDSQQFEVRHELILTADDGAALAVTYNGIPAWPLGRAGESATTRVNLTNFRDYLAAR